MAAPEKQKAPKESATPRRRRKTSRSVDKPTAVREPGVRKARVVKALLLVAALFCCGLPVLLIAHPISYVPFITVVLVIIFSAVYVQILAKTFSFDENSMASSCERGEAVGLSFTLQNRSILPHPYVEVAFYITDLFGEYDAMQHMSVPLSGHETSTYDFSAKFTHVGNYTAGIDHVVLHDLLGLFEKRVENPNRRPIVVRPRLFDFVGTSLSEVSDEEESAILKPISADSMDYASVREYRYGDPLKTVHWNLTSRNPEGTMYTRLFEVYVSPSLEVVMDPFCERESASNEELMSLFDGVIEGCASLFEYAKTQSVECSIRYLDRSFRPNLCRLASNHDADELVMGARRITLVSEHPNKAGIPLEMLRACAAASHGASNIAFVTSRLNETVVETVIGIARARRSPLLVLCVPALLIGRQRAEYLAPLKQLMALGIPYVLVESNEESSRRVRA